MYNNILEGLLNKNYFKFTPIFEYKDVSTLNEVQGTIKLNWYSDKKSTHSNYT